MHIHLIMMSAGLAIAIALPLFVAVMMTFMLSLLVVFMTQQRNKKPPNTK